MPTEVPILQKVHDRFDTYTRTPGADHSLISNATIHSRLGGYMIITHPGGTRGVDGFVIRAQTDRGIFDSKLLGVETSRQKAKSVGAENGETIGIHSISPIRRRVEPNAEGFTLFQELHQEVQKLKPELTGVVELIQPGIAPEIVVYEYTPGPTKFDSPTSNTISTYGKTKIQVSDTKGNSVGVVLDATRNQQKAEYNERPPRDSDGKIYREGTALVSYMGAERSEELDITRLIAFSGLDVAVRRLYVPNPA